jgi:2-succinyl-5-enolpyruvyl-6-hydroxy-3-cyclohexene-1-carboxylate synthase
LAVRFAHVFTFAHGRKCCAVNGIDAATSFARTLVDEWARNGIDFAVVCPGSRNTPLSLALVRDGRIRVDVVLDERSAAFRASGFGLATGRPAVVCCTSGTAAVNLHPAVVEAHYARVPLLVCTADRPAELQDWGAGQTIDQTRLYGNSVRWFHDPGPPEATADANERWRSLACRAVAHACGPPSGPVHLNLPFREPLVPTGEPLMETPGCAHGAPWVRTSPAEREASATDVDRLSALIRGTRRGVVVAGWGAATDAGAVEAFASRTGWPVLADPLSQLRTGSHCVTTYEALLRVDGFAGTHRPELVVRVGAPLTSKVANACLGGAPTVLIDPDRAWSDPAHAARERVEAEPEAFLNALTQSLPPAAENEWAAGWFEAEERARAAIDAVLDGDVACEARVARDTVDAVPDGGTLLVASSLPVRALEWSMSPRSGLRVVANRGANGIDGFVSTAFGVARGSAGPIVALCGDLCFLHDTNGLLGSDASPPVTFVVVDNGGGGIFDYLPQRELPEFEPLFATPQAADVVDVARAHGLAADRVDVAALPKLLAEGSDDVRALVVDVDRRTAREQHGRVWTAVASALGAGYT